MKHIILAAALLAFCTPAFAGGSHNRGGSTIGSTSATSGSGASVEGCKCGTGNAYAVGGHLSTAIAAVDPGRQWSATNTLSFGSGWANRGNYTAGGAGESKASTQGRF